MSLSYSPIGITMSNCLISLVSLFILYKYYDKIPSKFVHINRNKYNVFPVGNLTHIKDNKYTDKNNIIWIKRGFFNSLLHNPNIKYVFETYDINKISSQILPTLELILV